MIYNFGIRVWTALIVLWHSRPARILSLYTPDRSQGCKTGGSLISRWSQNRPFCCFCSRKWTWLTHPRWWHTHKKKLDAFQSTYTSQKFSWIDSGGRHPSTRAQNSIASVSYADIVFLRPRVCLAVRGKAPSARQTLFVNPKRHYQSLKNNFITGSFLHFRNLILSTLNRCGQSSTNILHW